jgi:hypothetical protein
MVTVGVVLSMGHTTAIKRNRLDLVIVTRGCLARFEK